MITLNLYFVFLSILKDNEEKYIPILDKTDENREILSQLTCE